MENVEIENQASPRGRIERVAARKATEQLAISAKQGRSIDRKIERDVEAGPILLENAGPEWAYEVWAKWHVDHLVPMYRVEMTENDNESMNEHGKWCRESVADAATRKRSIPAQPHPMVYAFATLLGFNTDSKLFMGEIFRIHGLTYPESRVVGNSGTAAHIYAVNEALEVYLRFRNNEFVTGGRGGRVWSESLKALQPYERYAINEQRVTALVKFSRRIRAVLRDTWNSKHILDQEISIYCPASIFYRLIGNHIEGSASSVRQDVVRIMIYRLSDLDVLFPPQQNDLESDETVHPLQQHSLVSRWYIQHFDHGAEAWRRKVVVPCILKYSRISQELWIKGRIACWSKLLSGPDDAAWGYKVSSALSEAQQQLNLQNEF